MSTTNAGMNRTCSPTESNETSNASNQSVSSLSTSVKNMQPPNVVIVADPDSQAEAGGLGEDDDVITSTMPPTQIVDTIVTTTTNPDGSLKRTTRKTTRTVVTTARIRRVKMKNEANQSSDTQKLLVDQGNDENSLGQAVVAFIPPQTEVTYQENVTPIHDIDPDTVAKLQQTGDSSQNLTDQHAADLRTPKALTKTTMRKTVTATAATATFYATGEESTNPAANLFRTHGGTSGLLFKSQCQRSTNSTISSDDTVAISNQPTIEEEITKLDGIGTSEADNTTSRPVVNSFGSKRFFFTTATHIITLKKPFNIFGHKSDMNSHTGDDPTHSARNKTIEELGNIDTWDTEQVALRAMKESERLFSEANILATRPSGTQLVNYSTDANDVQHYKSRFTNLPLYQGYGILMALTSNQLNNEGTVKSTTDQSELSKLDSSNVQRHQEQHQQDLNNQNQELKMVANTFASLLDDSIINFLQDAINQSGTSFSRFQSETSKEKGSIQTTPSSTITWLNQMKQAAPDGESNEQLIDNTEPSLAINTDQDEVHRHIIGRTQTVTPDEDTAQFTNKSESIPNADLINQEIAQSAVIEVSDVVTNEDVSEKATRLGVGSQGAFRVAWSDMPEVIAGNCLQRLTRHEIQLQEAMFEVITSEASYYQSLNVLVNHFYHAPEFECEPVHTATTNPGNSGGTFSPPLYRKSQSLYGAKEVTSTTQCTNQNTNVDTLTSNAATLTPVTVDVDMVGSSSQYSLNSSECQTNATSENGDNVGQSVPDLSWQAARRTLLKPLEKHHLFSNVLLVCLASEMFLRDLEARWEARLPVINEVCDLIVKHAGGVNFEPYITYLRNQTCQIDTLRKLCQRDSFRAALNNLHAHPKSGKNLLSSFLALPMQRLTRLKLLVEVIRRLQDAVVRDSMDSTLEHRPTRVPSVRERENVQLALKELNRLLTASESEKELMDRKLRLLTLSASLQFPSNVKRIAISDKRLIKEGELREFPADGKSAVLQKLSIRKPNTFYLILFNDLLLVTKKKKSGRFLVLDYCDRASVQAFVYHEGSQENGPVSPNRKQQATSVLETSPNEHDDITDDESTDENTITNRSQTDEKDDPASDTENAPRRKLTKCSSSTGELCATDTAEVDTALKVNQAQKSNPNIDSDKFSTNDNNNLQFNFSSDCKRLSKTFTNFLQITSNSSQDHVKSDQSVKSTLRQKINLSRSGSSLSSYQLRFNTDSLKLLPTSLFNLRNPISSSSNGVTGTIRQDMIQLKLTASHNGTCSNLYLYPKYSSEFENWCRALSVNTNSHFIDKPPHL